MSDGPHPGLTEPWLAVLRAFLVETHLRGGSLRTPLEYARILSRYAAHVGDPAAADSMRVRAFVYAPVAPGRPPAPSTVGVRLAAIGGLYRMAVEAGLVARNPAAGIRRPRPARRPPRGISARDLRRLVAAIPDDCEGSRDRAIVIVIVLTALRRAEALGLRVGDIDLASGSYVTAAKGGQVRQRQMPPPALQAIHRWLDCKGREMVATSPDALLFGIGPAAFYARLRRHGTVAAIDGCTPHALRHSAAQLRRGAGASMEEVSALLGHSSLATTARYLRMLEPELDDGWMGPARALGIGRAARPMRSSSGLSRIRAGPLEMEATGQVRKHQPGQSDRRAQR